MVLLLFVEYPNEYLVLVSLNTILDSIKTLEVNLNIIYILV